MYTDDDNNIFKGRIYAIDGGIPAKTATAIVKFIIDRNLNIPVFDQLSYVKQIYETESVRTLVIDVNAQDGDRIVSVCFSSSCLLYVLLTIINCVSFI